MHPTPEEQLRAVLRLIDGVVGDPALSTESKAMVEDAGRLVRRLERSLALRLPFLVQDNLLAAELLGGLTPLLPDLAAEIGEATERLPADDEPSAHERNKRLQGLLARAVHLLPDGPDGDAERTRIAEHLRARLAADPALNRAPSDRLPPEESNP